MITSNYNSINIVTSLNQRLEHILRQFDIPANTQRLVLNFRYTSYYQTKQGQHPIEIQLKKDKPSSNWQIVFFASFSYLNESASKVEPELYFHLANGWCYQPDSGIADLSHSEVQELFTAWMNAFSRHLSRNQFDSIQLTAISKFNQ